MFVAEFEKRADSAFSSEAVDQVKDRADVTARDPEDNENVHGGGKKNQLVRGRGGAKSRSSGQATQGNKTDQFSQDRQFIPERMTHFKRWENSRYGGGGGSSV